MSKQITRNEFPFHPSAVAAFWQHFANINREYTAEDDLDYDYVESEFEEMTEILSLLSGGTNELPAGQTMAISIGGKRLEISFSVKLSEGEGDG